MWVWQRVSLLFFTAIFWTIQITKTTCHCLLSVKIAIKTWSSSKYYPNQLIKSSWQLYTKYFFMTSDLRKGIQRRETSDVSVFCEIHSWLFEFGPSRFENGHNSSRKKQIVFWWGVFCTVEQLQLAKM